MAETPATSPAVETDATPETPKPNRLKSLTTKYPRATRVAKLTAAGVALVGATSVAKNMQHNRAKVNEAVDHAKESVAALSDSVVTPDPEA